MRRLIAVVVVLLVASGSLLARRVPAEKALGYARNWWLQKDGPRFVVLQQVQTEFQNIYLFVDTAGRGFVMLAADDRSLPVLGYSLSNGFVADSTMPAAVHDWVQDYDDQIQFLIDNNIEKTAEINEQWRDLNNEMSLLPQAWGSKGPLLTTKWGQGYYYNRNCPNNCKTGCVATAMAQIMNYYEFPNSGIGINSYTTSSSGYSLSVNFANVTYDWSNMPPSRSSSMSTDAQVAAVCTLMYHAGVAVNMNYGSSESSANTVAMTYDVPAAVNAYKKYFKYKWTARCVYIGDYTTTDWKLLLKGELDANRPIQYSGSYETYGHSWVCDGYDSNENFHMNWGGEGTDDGYFAIGALNPGSKYYNNSNKAIVGIEPDETAGNTITITASSNDVLMGTVNGVASFTQTYNKYDDEVVITPVANEGFRFVGWSNGSKEVPLRFLANGDNASIIANFEPIAGGDLYYCNAGKAGSYGTWAQPQYAAIRIPAGSLTAGSTITHISIYSVSNYNYTVYLYKGTLAKAQPDYSYTYNPGISEGWANVKLPAAQSIDVTQDLYIAVQSYTYCAYSMSAANEDASYTKSNSANWSKLQVGGAYVAWMIKAITTSPVPSQHSININASVVNLTSVSKDENLRSAGLGTSNKGATVSYKIVSSYPANIATITDDYKLTAYGVGTVRIKAYAIDAQSNYAESEVDLRIGRGTLTWNNYDNHFWSESSYWGPNGDVVPDSINYDVDIKGALIIDVDANCHNLNTSYASVITVNRDAKLEVSGTVTTQSVYNIYIKADEYGSGTVIFGSGTPKGTVEMYLKGTIGPDGKDPQWQLRGSILDNFGFEPYNYGKWDDVHVYEWDESLNASGCWKNKMVGTQMSLDLWKGYGFANYSINPIVVTYSGTLINSDHTWTLTKTGSGNANVGANLLTNSYAAPIEISKLQFNDARSSVIFYNTGSLLEWQQYGGSLSNTGTNPGQYLVCPAVTSPAAGMPTAIPSGQSFYVVANQDGATVSISYKDVMQTTSGPMFAPAEDEQFNVLGVRVTGENGGDRAVLIECERCSDDYDDGYDGMKYFGNAALPQLYVANDFGNTSINAAESIVGKRLGVHTSDKGKCLTMTFETEKLNNYSQLKLKDLKTGKYADILSGREYQFTTTGDDDARFEVVGFADEEQGFGDELTVAGNTLYVGKYAGRVSMYDMSGRLVWRADVRNNEWFELPELLNGVYVIKTDNKTIKVVI